MTSWGLLHRIQRLVQYSKNESVHPCPQANKEKSKTSYHSILEKLSEKTI